MTWRRFLVAMFFLAPSLAVAQSPPTLEMSFLSDAVEVSHVTEGGEVVWFGASQEIAGDEIAEMSAYATIVEDDDHDGVGRLVLEKGVPLHSVWVAVDLTTGAAVAGAPEGYPLQMVSWRGAGLEHHEGGDEVVDARPMGNVLVVRPGVGAWRVESGDGGPADIDGAVDGAIRLAISDLEPVGGTKASSPSPLAPGDVVVMLDPRLLELTLETIAN